MTQAWELRLREFDQGFTNLDPKLEVWAQRFICVERILHRYPHRPLDPRLALYNVHFEGSGLGCGA